MFFRRDCPLVFEYQLGPLQTRDDRFEQPFHAERVIVNPPQVNIRGNFPIGQRLFLKQIASDFKILACSYWQNPLSE